MVKFCLHIFTQILLNLADLSGLPSLSETIESIQIRAHPEGRIPNDKPKIVIYPSYIQGNSKFVSDRMLLFIPKWPKKIF